MSVEQRDRLIRQLRDLLRNRPEILFALLHRSFLAGGLFRDVDLALYLEPGQSIGRHFVTMSWNKGSDGAKALGLPVDVRLLNDAPVSFR